MRLAPFENVSVQLFSSLSRLGADEAAGVIEGWLQQAGDAVEDVAESAEGAESPESVIAAEAGARPD